MTDYHNVLQRIVALGTSGRHADAIAFGEDAVVGADAGMAVAIIELLGSMTARNCGAPAASAYLRSKAARDDLRGLLVAAARHEAAFDLPGALASLSEALTVLNEPFDRFQAYLAVARVRLDRDEPTEASDALRAAVASIEPKDVVATWPDPRLAQRLVAASQCGAVEAYIELYEQALAIEDNEKSRECIAAIRAHLVNG